MRRLGVLLGLCLVPALPASVDAATVPTVVVTDAGEDEPEVEAAFVKVTLTKDGKTYKHPGFRVIKDEAGVFVIECDGNSHEIAVLLRSSDGERLTVNVEYTVDGSAVFSQDVTVDAGKDTNVGGGANKIAINVDPRGKTNTKRKDEDKLEEPAPEDPDDPLAGI